MDPAKGARVLEQPHEVCFEDEIVQVAACGTTTLVLLSSGQVLSWGSGADGKLGLGDGRRDHWQPQLVRFPPEAELPIQEISAGIDHVLAIDSRTCCLDEQSILAVCLCYV